LAITEITELRDTDHQSEALSARVNPLSAEAEARLNKLVCFDTWLSLEALIRFVEDAAPRRREHVSLYELLAPSEGDEAKLVAAKDCARRIHEVRHIWGPERVADRDWHAALSLASKDKTLASLDALADAASRYASRAAGPSSALEQAAQIGRLCRTLRAEIGSARTGLWRHRYRENDSLQGADGSSPDREAKGGWATDFLHELWAILGEAGFQDRETVQLVVTDASASEERRVRALRNWRGKRRARLRDDARRGHESPPESE
jgi:hypothetical protein